MKYIATYFVRGERNARKRPFGTFDGALRFQARGMDNGDHFVGEISDCHGETVVNHDWLLDHWSAIVEVLNRRQPPTACEPARRLYEKLT